MTTNKRNDLKKNAEVTEEGIKARGDPVKGKQQLISVKSTPIGTLKKRILTGCLTISGTANAVGLASDWTPDMVHVAYPLAAVVLLGLFLIYITKME